MSGRPNRASAAVLLTLAFLPAACGTSGERGPGKSGAAEAGTAAVEAQLMEADRAFARATTDRGLDGWTGSMAEDVARIDLQGAIARGPEAVRVHDARMFADPATRLAWEPTDAGVFVDGRHGFTRGKYRVIRGGGDAGDPRTIGSGEYVTIWRRDDGVWKVILDTGAPDPPAPDAAMGAPIPSTVGRDGERPDPVATFSILGYDPATGEIGGAVQSRVFSVGNGVLWAEAGVGAVATQAVVDVSYGPQAIDLLRRKIAPIEVIRKVRQADPDPLPAEWTKEGRQFAVMNARGEVAAFTGPKADAWAGHRVGPYCSAQGNILAGPEVVDRMVQAFTTTAGHLSLRLLAALEAGQAAGGDTRGMQSAAMLIVHKDGGPWLHHDVVLRLQVDDNPEPIRELRRLVEKADVERRESEEWWRKIAAEKKPAAAKTSSKPGEENR